MIPKLTVYAKYLYLLMVLMIVVEIKGYPNVQLQSHCSHRYVRVEGKKLFANETSMYPQNFTLITENHPTHGVIMKFFYQNFYVCFNPSWQPRLFEEEKLSMRCYFKEKMEQGYALFHSVLEPEKYLGFNKKGKPINFNKPLDKQCFKLMKRDPDPDGLDRKLQQTIHVPNKQHHHHHGGASHTKSPTSSNKLESSKSHKTSSSSSSKLLSSLQPSSVKPTAAATTNSANPNASVARATRPSKSRQRHRIRHHHDQLPLRSNHNTISHKNNKNLELGNNNGKRKQAQRPPQQQQPDESLDNADNNKISIYNQKFKNGVNIVDESENKENKRVHHRHHQQQPSKKRANNLQKKLLMNKLSNDDDRLQERRPNDEIYDNHIFNDTNNNYSDSDNNCTYCTINNVDDATMASDINSIESQMSSSAASTSTGRILTTLWPTTSKLTTTMRSGSGGNHSSKNSNTHDKPNNHKIGNERRQPRRNNANGRQSQNRTSHQQRVSSHKQQHLQP